MALIRVTSKRCNLLTAVFDKRWKTVLLRGRTGSRARTLAATAMAAQMPVEQLALVPYSFPTYANALGRTAVGVAIELDRTGKWRLITMQIQSKSRRVKLARGAQSPRGRASLVRS